MGESTGKGDTYRPVDRKKYELNYLRVFGIKCPNCHTSIEGLGTDCPVCLGVGYIERKK